MLIRHCYQCAHSSRQSPLQGRNRVAHARAPRYECHQKMKAHALRHNKFFQPSESMRTSLTSINPPGGATSLRTRALQFANVTRQSMRGHRAASDAQPSESMRTFLASIDPPRAQPRCARARSNSRMSRDNQCAYSSANHPSKGATALRMRALQFANVTRQSMRAPTSSLNRIRTTANRQGCASRIFRHCRSRAPQGSG